MSDWIALVFEEREFTAERLEALARGLAGTLERRGVRSGDRVALMSSNRPEFVVAVLALWRLGAAVVLFSPAWKRGEAEHAIAITEPAHAVGDHPVLAGMMPMLHLDDPIEPGGGGPAPERDPDADAVLVFSSGTTGLPKAVRHTHRSFAAAVRHWRDALGLTGTDRMQITTPPSHILGLLNIVTALESGVWTRLHRRFDLDAMLRHIEADRITVEMAVAPIALAMASHPRLESYDLSSLRYIMWGATPVTPSVAETVTRRTGVGWVPAYGATEVPVIACNPLDGARLDSVGRPVPGVEARVVSLETGEPVPPGETGEIQVRAESLMAGYLPAEATAASLDDGWYRTGDVGNIDAGGWLRLTDRTKEMIKVRGFQVAPAEVEAVLHGHPAVDDCAVFGVPDAADGERVVAAVAAGAEVDPAELVALVGERLASYKRPERVLLVPEIPRLPSGKVLRRVLRDRLGPG
ncbi:AMP-binding protein [Actinomadura sp. 7K507]|uniref:class I adenylate-forming enzyme family protein n=1 Tax=Actinomadura sp. 7K507 TaxID=2530365 RepID=UPI00104AA7D9|nr:AMP-binding protein [Actinomadura sp. 7K507]TDC97959.1 long-chain fatty acid--CoA ligase [Actinomadura sp. 7K507]